MKRHVSPFVRARVFFDAKDIERFGAVLHPQRDAHGDVGVFVGTRGYRDEATPGWLLNISARDLARVVFASWPDRAEVRWSWRAANVSLAVRQAARVSA
jgi:hypothetical protein